MKTTMQTVQGVALLLLLTLVSTTMAKSIIDVDTPMGIQKFQGADEDSTCTAGDKTYGDGVIFREFFWNKCILSRCEGGRRVAVRSDCVDSYLECHPNGSYWRQGCRVYLCRVSSHIDASGSTTTKYEPVKIREDC